MRVDSLNARTCTAAFAAVFGLFFFVFSIIAHGHFPLYQSETSLPLKTLHQSNLTTSTTLVPHNGYTSADWYRSIHKDNCTGAFLLQGVKVVDDVNCTVSKALFLLLRQSYRYNKHKWTADISNFTHRINRTMYAHELFQTDAGQNFELQYVQPSTTCLVWAHSVVNMSFSPVVSSVSVVQADSDSIVFALFSAPTKTSHVLLAQVYANSSISLSFAKVEGLHRLRNHSPSAAFLPSENLALANLGKTDYDVALYERKGDEYVDLKMQSPYRVGGENIGSLFRFGGSLHMSARFNVPYVPLDRDGHGYRSVGLYNITHSPDGHRSELIDWISPDACISECLQDLHKTCGEVLLLNATSLLRCLPREGILLHSKAGFMLTHVYAPCLRSALSVSSTSSSSCVRARKELLVNGLLCAHRCRSTNQIYMPPISSIKGSWYGVLGRFDRYGQTTHEAVNNENVGLQGGNPLLLCQLSKSLAWSPSCFDNNAAFMYDHFGTPGHPLTSQIVDLGGNMILASVGNRIPTEKEQCSAYLNSWSASNFSYFQAVDTASASFKVTLRNIALPSNLQISILYGSKQSTLHCTNNIVLQAFNHRQCRAVRIDQNLFENNTGDVRFQLQCESFKAATVTLHIHMPSSCQLYGIGP